MDRYGVQALIDYWEEVVLTKELKETIRKNGRGEIYMDSLELLSYGAGGIFWGYDLKAEFLKRQGYDITRYLPLITMDKARVTGRSPKEYDYVASGAGAEELTEKVRADYYHVISDMYVENVLLPLQTWLHSLGMTLRAEPSYGVNFEISTPARALDGVETESFAQAAELDLYRGMSGSANMYGRKFSSETERFLGTIITIIWIPGQDFAFFNFQKVSTGRCSMGILRLKAPRRIRCGRAMKECTLSSQNASTAANRHPSIIRNGPECWDAIRRLSDRVRQ